MRGFDVLLLTGTDEHGQKIERSAAKAGKTPQDLPRKFPPSFAGCGTAWASPTTTTSAPRNRGINMACKCCFSSCNSADSSTRAPIPASIACGTNSMSSACGKRCPDCGRLTETVSEENYFFKLSAFERKLLEYYEQHPEFIRPESASQ